MKTKFNFGRITVNNALILTFFCLFISLESLAQKSGVWTANGSGASTTWTTNAGDIQITASATDYGSGTSYTMNDFVTSDTMGCSNSAYSDATIVGNPSLSVRHTFPNTAELTFNFSKAVENPVMHLDRLGGGQVNNRTTSSLVTILTPGITYTKLSGNGSHFVVTPTTVGRLAGQTYTSLPSECGPPIAGTASGSVRLNGVFSTITFEIAMDAVGGNGSINDRWEVAFSEVQSLTLDFDGDNDYINREAFLGNRSQVTMMSWIKLDSGYDGGEVMGQRNFRLLVNGTRRLRTYVKTNTGSNTSIITPSGYSPVLDENLWYHVATVYDGSNGRLSLFLNGEEVWSYSNLSGSHIVGTSAWDSDYDFEIGRYAYSQNQYFEGSINEVKVFNKALTENQIKQQVNQQIENNSGSVRGTVIPKDIEGLQWSDLILYYKMDILDSGQTSDTSNSGVNGHLHGMRTYQDYTAPLPYETKSGGSGNWEDANNWLHGDVWDIPNSHSSAAIIKITESLTTNRNHETVGLIIDSGKSLQVNGDSGLFNSWYLKLDGHIDLQGESQLIQSEGSELVITSAGSLERDQQGTRDMFTYNYWSSPVGDQSTTSNNTSYTVGNMFKDGTNPASPLSINFITNGYDGTSGTPIGIADYWIWKFANQPDDDYSAWQHVRSSGSLNPGEGFTMKGVANTNGNISLEQNYVVRGKPNNGDITLPISGGHDYLIGNPYASAIDAHEFILDNAPTIDAPGNTTGTLYFWEHWGGGSHVLHEYQGGYATYNLAGAVPAVAFGTADPDVDQSNLIGTKLPGRYIPVGQGFFVVGENTGTIRFKNSQRAFMTEATNASTFMRLGNETTQSSEDTNDDESDLRIKIRLKFNSASTYSRKILVTVDQNASMEYDWGYDAVLYDNQVDDMYWLIGENKYVIQGINQISPSTVLPLGVNFEEPGTQEISIDKLENLPPDADIFIHDKELSLYHDLREEAYSFETASGVYPDRFDIVFQMEETLSTNEVVLSDEDITIYHDFDTENIVIKNPNNLTIKSVEVFSILGQSVYSSYELTTSSELQIETNGYSTGAYIVKIETETGNFSKKILVN